MYLITRPRSIGAKWSAAAIIGLRAPCNDDVAGLRVPGFRPQLGWYVLRSRSGALWLLPCILCGLGPWPAPPVPDDLSPCPISPVDGAAACVYRGGSPGGTSERNRSLHKTASRHCSASRRNVPGNQQVCCNQNNTSSRAHFAWLCLQGARLLSI